MTSASFVPGEHIGAYEVVSLLGTGGMGEVYRAKDTRLGREVAIKVLPSTFASDADRLRRFVQEARAASALNHPNILVVHDIGTHQDAPYLVTELLEGETLRSRLSGGSLSAKKSLEIGIQVASGLAAAHEKGIVHRDLKPENLFLTKDGHVKILDFGLAKQTPQVKEVGSGETSTVDVEPGTDPGTVMGTAAYMSPEQVRGQAVDQRSDIFSLGCVLYEMAAGRRAFSRETLAETMTAILREDPPEVGSVNAEVPAGFARAIGHCLEKNPEERFQTARDLGFALKAALADSGETRTGPAVAQAAAGRTRWALAAGIVALVVLGAAGAWWGLRGRAKKSTVKLEPKRVVVAIFENQTGDKSLDSLGRMAADWIGQGLSRVEGIEAVPSMAVLSDAPPPAGTARAADPLRDLAERTGAGTVVSGTYYLQGQTLQFQVRLADMVGESLIYAIEPIRGSRDDPMKAIDLVNQKVAGAIALHFEGTYKPGQVRPPLLDAYREYVAGMELFGTDYERSIEHCRKALEIDPDFGQAQILIAIAYLNQGEYERAADIHRRLDQQRNRLTLFETHVVDWLGALLDGHTADALRHIEDAVKLFPRSSGWAYGVAHESIGVNRPGRTIEVYERAIREGFVGVVRRATPTDSWWYTFAAGPALHMLSSYERELELANRAIEAFPSLLSMREIKVRALIGLGRIGEIEAVLDEASAISSQNGTLGDLMRETARELRAHGHHEASLAMANRAIAWYRGRPEKETKSAAWQRGMANALLWAERWDESRKLYEALAAGDSPRVDDIGMVGIIAAMRGDRATALKIAGELERLDRKWLFGQHTFCRAGIAAHLGEKERAVELQREAFAQGGTFGVWVHSSFILEPLRGYPPFEELIKPKG